MLVAIRIDPFMPVDPRASARRPNIPRNILRNTVQDSFPTRIPPFRLTIGLTRAEIVANDSNLSPQWGLSMRIDG